MSRPKITTPRRSTVRRMAEGRSPLLPLAAPVQAPCLPCRTEIGGLTVPAANPAAILLTARGPVLAAHLPHALTRHQHDRAVAQLTGTPCQ